MMDVDQAHLIQEQKLTIKDLKHSIEDLKKSSEEFQKKLIDELECPVCMETCQPPILMCKNGHSVCSPCQALLDKCPKCRLPGQPEIKNLFAENVRRQLGKPCVNEKGGCLYFIMNIDVDDHEDECRYRHECGICDYTSSVACLETHVSQNHPDHFVAGNKWEGNVSIEFDTNSFIYLLYKGVLFSCRLFSSLGGFYMSAIVYEASRKYKCWFDLMSNDRSMKYCYSVRCFNDDAPLMKCCSIDKVGELRQNKKDNTIYCVIKIYE